MGGMANGMPWHVCGVCVDQVFTLMWEAYHLRSQSNSLAQEAKFLDLVNSQPRVGGKTKSCLDVVSNDLETRPGETA